MHKYRSHKGVVEAARIIEATEWHDGAVRLELEGENKPGVDNALYLQGDKRDMWEHDLRQHFGLAKTDLPDPQLFIGGYVVRYPPENYESWLPAQAFEECYSLLQPNSGKSKIKGHQELDKETIELMNEVRTLASSCGRMIDIVNAFNSASPSGIGEEGIQEEIARKESYRWTAIAKTHLQQGFMALTRAIAKPDFF